MVVRKDTVRVQRVKKASDTDDFTACTATTAFNTAIKALSDAAKRPSSDLSDKTTKATISQDAEKARAALSWMRLHEKELEGVLQPQQLENGMLALIGKCISNGLQTLAWKESGILKKRLDKCAGVKTLRGAVKEMNVLKKQFTPDVGLVTELLNTQGLEARSPWLRVIASAHVYVLRLLALRSDPRLIEAAIPHLDLDDPHCIWNLAVVASSTASEKQSSAKQLDNLSHILLSLCPSASSSADETAGSSNTVLGAGPTFRLQVIALKLRRSWWSLVGHRPDDNTEIWTPLYRYCSALIRRMPSKSAGTYALAKNGYESLCTEKGAIANGAQKSIIKLLSAAAQKAGAATEAIQWISQAEPDHESDSSEPTQCIISMRIATIAIDSKSSDAPDHVVKAVGRLKSCRTAETPESNELLVEISRFSKSASRSIVQWSKAADPDGLSSKESLLRAFDIATTCVAFLLEYIARNFNSAVNGIPSCYTKESRGLIRKLGPGFIEANILVVHHLIKASVLDFDEVDKALQPCVRLYNTLVLYDSSDAGLAVKLSAMYLNFYATEIRPNEGNEASVLMSLARSTEILRDCKLAEKKAGNLIGKMEKLAKAYLSCDRMEQALATCEDAIREVVQLEEIRQGFGMHHDTAPELVFAHDSLLPLPRLFRLLARIIAEQSGADMATTILRLSEAVSKVHRSTFLELALSLHPSLVVECPEMPCKILDLYHEGSHEVAGLRVALLCSVQGKATDSLGLEARLRRCQTSQGADTAVQTSRQAVLTRYYSVSLRVLSALSASDQPSLEAGVQEWQEVLNTHSLDDDPLLEAIDVLQWMQNLEAVAAYAASRGLAVLAVATLTTLLEILERSRPLDMKDIVTARTRLAVQCLELGHSSRAGIALAKSSRYLGNSELPTLTRIQHHLTHADYQLKIGSLEGAVASLELAANQTVQDPSFLRAARGSSATTFPAQQAIAQAWMLYSRLSSVNGNISVALDFARRSVKLAQRLWMSVETSTGSSVKTGVQKVNSATAAPLDPPILSKTHDALKSAALWPLVPTIFDSFFNLAKIYAHIGDLAQAVSWAEQAKRVVIATEHSRGLASVSSFLTDCYIGANKIDKAQTCLDEAWACKDAIKGSPELVQLHASMALMWRAGGEHEDEEESYAAAFAGLKMLQESEQRVDTSRNADEELVELVATLDIKEQKPLKAGKTPRPTARKVAQTKSKRAAQPPDKLIREEQLGPQTTQCIPLVILEGCLLRSQAESLLAQKQFAKAADLIAKADHGQYDRTSDMQQRLATSHRSLTEGLQAMHSDFTFGVLPESTISLPATSAPATEPVVEKTAKTASVKATKSIKPKAPTRALTTKKSKQAAADAPRTFTAPLIRAQDGFQSSFTHFLHIMSARLAYRAARSLRSVSVMLSAVRQTHDSLSVHPLYATAHFESLQAVEDRRAKSVSLIENTSVDKGAVLSWPTISSNTDPLQGKLDAEFLQRDFIDIIPSSWAAISISMDDTKQDLIITRYEANLSPFILRLPLSRHKSHCDMDDEDDLFDMASGRAEMLEILDLANFSAHDAKDMSYKGAKAEWWAAREALDNRLRDLLVNIESIWLGGFRGIFSEQSADPQLLANFSQALQDTVNRHLPSRRGRGAVARSRPLDLDPRILQLFTGLGNPADEKLDLDEPLLDLLYFVIDILQFSGERNAYDEIDFDTMVIETLDALKIYHAAAAHHAREKRHTILILDKDLHLFPWESMPCMGNSSVSRLPSLVALQTRLLAANTANAVTDSGSRQAGHYVSRLHGQSMLNPGGDLANTQAALTPCLQALPSRTWTHSTAAPTEPEMASILATQDLFLYFGHGSGAQYIRPRTVKKQSRAPLAWLMGCSSSAITENGDFQSEGMVLAYLQAGAPAVVGTLWDVTDRDCDRASAEIGEKWGLWKVGAETRRLLEKGRYRRKKEEEVEVARTVVPKTPGKRRGRGEDNVGKTPGFKARGESPEKPRVSLNEAIVAGREACYLQYLNGAAFVVYGIPAYLTD